MISILFVDDEVNILEGIRNSLRKHMKEWHLEFANSGEEALQFMARLHFDIIVSDMRMPRMDGATLLSIVQKMYPAVSRFILTGQADQESMLRAIPVTHQFIYKPCNPPELIALLERTCALHCRIQSEEIRHLVGAAEAIPSIPETTIKLNEILSGSQWTLSDISHVVEHDPGLCARIIQVSNSAFCGRSKEVTSIQEAVSIVGIECVQALAIANQFFAETADNQHCLKLLRSTYTKGFEGLVSVARFLPKHPDRAAAMTSALLRDIGIIILAMSKQDVTEEDAELKAEIESVVPYQPGTETLFEMETRLGVTHSDLAGHLLALWGTPMSIVEAVTLHHTIDQSTIDPMFMVAVHVADILAENGNQNLDKVEEALNWEFIEAHNLRSTVEGWLELDFELTKKAA